MEKQYAPTASEKKLSSKKMKAPTEKISKDVKKPEEKKKEIEEQKQDKQEEKKEVQEKKQETKIQPKKVKRDYAIVNGYSTPVSTKEAVAICRFIRGMSIKQAINELENVLRLKRVIPMKGEIPHRKGEAMAGRYPRVSSQEMIKLLKSLLANANFNDMENPIISEAISNKAQRPFGKGGRTRKKRTHIKLVAREKKEKKENKK